MMFDYDPSCRPALADGLIPPKAAGPSDRSTSVGPATGFGSAAYFDGLLGGCDAIDLAEMDAFALQNRTDTKFVMSVSQLADALAALGDRYRVLEIDGERVHPYRTLYFDTAGLDLYLHHHAGRCNRYKVRSRQYVRTRQSFLEVKHKTNKDRTEKSRITTREMVTRFCPQTRGFVDAHLPADTRPLAATLSNCFSRVTLVSKHHAERLTLDFDVRFATDDGAVSLPGLAIAEVKQAGVDRGSDFIRRMRATGLREMSFSKYCIGVSMLYPGVKRNRFKRNLDAVARLANRPAGSGFAASGFAAAAGDRLDA